jgi:hypothetical protein
MSAEELGGSALENEIDVRTEADRARILWVKGQRCLAEGAGGCNGPIHAHHAGEHPGLGLKPADDTVIPLCQEHHHAWHNNGPPFGGASKALRRMWANLAISFMRVRYYAGMQARNAYL